MKKVKVRFPETNYTLEGVGIADDLVSRIVGLMFKKSLSEITGLLIKPCNSIHTFFMRFDLDVLFISSSGEIVKVIRGMKPWRMSWIYFRASQVLEIKGGTLPHDIKHGMKIEVLHV